MAKDYIPEDGPKAPFGFFRNSYKKNDNHPDYVGDMTITDTLMKQIIALRNEGKMAVIGVAGWLKESSNGPYVSCQIQIDTYRTAKRYGVDESEIAGTINAVNSTAKPKAPASHGASDDPFLTATQTQGQGQGKAQGSGADTRDIFDDPLPSGGGASPLSEPDDDLPF